ncbi:hypothetical protein J2W55_003955 [Mucilaginibacter pocheonensis]|uniref:Uncharacterized protein n=1 Tax=Mucilaginibacter pocheonensis TaxID=398050 RepID=A0ABU1TFB4_9SPHI|nr:hypothetical protein [Mucilaginibacter pocheonensis]MDR6944095.1 hypothetical protein [Mucilaginibacter pocheonensis]
MTKFTGKIRKSYKLCIQGRPILKQLSDKNNTDEKIKKAGVYARKIPANRKTETNVANGVTNHAIYDEKKPKKHERPYSFVKSYGSQDKHKVSSHIESDE